MEAIELVEILCPKHDRTTCSDEKICNGFYQHSIEGAPRCSRCALLELLDGADMPEPIAGNVYFDTRDKDQLQYNKSLHPTKPNPNE